MYKTLNHFLIKIMQPGDIIKVKQSVYTDTIISEKWAHHFIDVFNFYRIQYIKNSGLIAATNKAGKTVYIQDGDRYNPIIEVYRKTI